MLNPVERRLVELLDRWHAFLAQRDKRLLIWQAQDNATRMLQCFFEVQKHETPYTAGDLFIVFDAPFEHAIQYSRALKETLAGQYEASREDIAAQAIAPDWSFVPDALPDTASGFVQAMASFVAQHPEISGHIVVVLMPQAMVNPEAFGAWLRRCLDVRLPESLRLVTFDSLEHPRLSSLVDAHHPLLLAESLPLDALSTAHETFAQEGGVGPAAVFRNYLIGLVSLVEKGSAEQVVAKSADALAFARGQHWPDQEVVVTMLVAGALLKEQRFDAAIPRYQEARQGAEQATAAGHPAGQKLVMQTWFGEAGAHFAAGAYPQAAACYEQAAVVAQQVHDPILGVEAFRMSAYCHARAGEGELARDRGDLALQLGARMEPEQRPMTTLPVAVVDLLRVVEPERVTAMEDIKRREIAEQDRALTVVEERAAKMEAGGDPAQLRAAEDQLAADTAEAEQRAAQALDAVVASASPEFREIFARGRKLLSPTWPLGMPVALPAANVGVPAA